MVELGRIEIPLYIRKVRLSDARRAEYYELGKKTKLAKKYQDQTRYKWKPEKTSKGVKVYLFDNSTGKKVLKNSRSVGTPKDKTINNQAIYNQSVMYNDRNKMIQQLKEFLVPFVAKLDVIKIEDLPIRIEAEVHRPILAENGMPWDVDNHFGLYQKAFQDVLQGNKDRYGKPRSKVVVPEDHNLIISKPPSPLHIPVHTEEERKLVFIIQKENDPRILNFSGREALFNKFVV